MLRASLILSALVFGAMPTAGAELFSGDDVRPYVIVFDGAVYPPALETMEYPYYAASRGIEGQCTLAVETGRGGAIAGLSVLSCSDPVFTRAAQRFIDTAPYWPADRETLTVHHLRVTWAMERDTPALERLIAHR